MKNWGEKKKKKIPCGIHVQSGHLSSWYVYFDNTEWTRVLSVGAILCYSCGNLDNSETTGKSACSRQGAHLRIFLKKCCAWGRKVEVWENKINIVRFLHQALNVKKTKPRDIFFPHQKEYCLPFKPGSIFRVKVVGEQWEQLCLKAAEVSVSILRTRRRKCSGDGARKSIRLF